MMSLRFSKKPVLNYDDAVAASSKNIYSQLFNFLLKKGIYFPPADLESFFISGAHSKKDLSRLLEALKEFFNRRQRS